MAPKKFSNDNVWLEANKNFLIEDAVKVVSHIALFQNEKLMAHLKSLKSLPREHWTMLPGFSFTAEDIAKCAQIDLEVVQAVITAFSLPPANHNPEFIALNSFNATNALPIIRGQENEFILFQYYSIAEALYESPFYWMGADKSYVAKAFKK